MDFERNRPLFNKTVAQLRGVGARGGRATARNRRARRIAQVLARQERVLLPGETVVEAIAVLDAQFPWLRGAESRSGALDANQPAR